VDDNLFICVVEGRKLNVSNEDVQWIKKNSIESNRITKMFIPKTT